MKQTCSRSTRTNLIRLVSVSNNWTMRSARIVFSNSFSSEYRERLTLHGIPETSVRFYVVEAMQTIPNACPKSGRSTSMTFDSWRTRSSWSSVTCKGASEHPWLDWLLHLTSDIVYILLVAFHTNNYISFIVEPTTIVSRSTPSNLSVPTNSCSALSAEPKRKLKE